MPAAAEQLTSPYDPDARYSTKRDIEWIGYKVHLTETCDADTPHLMVNVETTPATTPDDHMAAVVHQSLRGRTLLPREHLVDKGYTDAQMLVDSQREYGVTIVGPVADDPGWQAREATGFDKSQFVVDWERQVVTCPAGKQSISWLPAYVSGQWDGVRGSLCASGLYPVYVPCPLHACEDRAPDCRVASPRAG